MRSITIGLLAAGMLAASVQTALPGEDELALAPGEGQEQVMNYCAACHSIDYVLINAPFLDEKGWTNTVTKMVKTFGAPIEEADQKAIIAYLAANYGKPKS